MIAYNMFPYKNSTGVIERQAPRVATSSGVDGAPGRSGVAPPPPRHAYRCEPECYPADCQGSGWADSSHPAGLQRSVRSQNQNRRWPPSDSFPPQRAAGPPCGLQLSRLVDEESSSNLGLQTTRGFGSCMTAVSMVTGMGSPAMAL